MAEHLASIFGTEQDKVNCSFYFKIGACRHGEKCCRVHNKPTFSQTVLLRNLYLNPNNAAIQQNKSNTIFDQQPVSFHTDEEVQKHFDEFFEEVYTEVEEKVLSIIAGLLCEKQTSTTLTSSRHDVQNLLKKRSFSHPIFIGGRTLHFFSNITEKYGEIDAMTVCDNLGEHLVGNIYIKFRLEEDAERAVKELNNRWFDRKPIYAELSPVTDFKEASCRQYETGSCNRSGFCNFMHIKTISQDAKKRLRKRQSRKRSHNSSPSRKTRRY